MATINDKCQVCTGTESLKLDQFYSRMLCSTHWEQRKRDSIANQHGEWLEANGCLQELAEMERGDASLGSLDVQSSGDWDGRS